MDVRRIQNVILKYPDIFEKRVFTDNERHHAGRQACPYRSYSKRFAAKEAISKALGTGIGKKLSWQDMEITNDALGRPMVIFSQRTKKLLMESIGSFEIWLSLSDEFPYAQAMAVCAAVI